MQNLPPPATAAPQGDVPEATGTMVVCGDDALAHRLAAELRTLYGETVTLVVPGAGQDTGQPTGGRARASMLLGRISAAVTRATATATAVGGAGGAAGGTGRAASGGRAAPGERGGTGESGGEAGERVIAAPEPTADVLADAGVPHAAALALVYEDDETNIRAALAARRINPRLRLVIRLYNRRLGQHVQALLDQAAALALPDTARADGAGADGVGADGAGADGAGAGTAVPDAALHDASTTVLSDADTVAPALAATAVANSSKVVQAGGLLLHADEVGPGYAETPEERPCTLALLSSTRSNPAGAEGHDASGSDAPDLLPDEASAAQAAGRGKVVLRTVSYSGPATAPRGSVPLGSLLSRRLRWSFAGLVAAVLALAVVSMLTTGDPPLHATYLTLLDLFAIGDPAVGAATARKILQLLSGLVGLLLLPVLLAAVLEALGSFRSHAVTRRPPRGLSDHVVLLGLGKIGTRVLVELRQLNIPVVCVETDPEARGIAVARRLRVPVVLGDVTHEGVLESAKVHRARALLALTSADTTNLEAALIARSSTPGLRVVLRLYDDQFATVVYRTLRAAHPGALTRSRSVSHMAAPAFAVAMMGRQILGAIPVERRVLLFAAVDVAGHPQLEGHTVADAFRPGYWRVLGLDTTGPAGRRSGAGASPRTAERIRGTPGQVWDLDPDYVLNAHDRIVLAATRHGLAELLARRPRRSGAS